jgi:hypothetical protein
MVHLVNRNTEMYKSEARRERIPVFIFEVLSLIFLYGWETWPLNFKGRTNIVGILEQGAQENICTQDG